MTTAKSDETQLTKEAETEATEIKEDIKETKEEAEAARAAGDTAAAERLDGRVTAMETKLDGIADTLKTLAERPFHPAPEAKKEEAKEETKEEEKEVQEEEKPKERKHRFGSTTWFKDRAYED